MNLKIAPLIINNLRILRLQGFKAQIVRGILTPALQSSWQMAQARLKLKLERTDVRCRSILIPPAALLCITIRKNFVFQRKGFGASRALFFHKETMKP